MMHLVHLNWPNRILARRGERQGTAKALHSMYITPYGRAAEIAVISAFSTRTPKFVSFDKKRRFVSRQNYRVLSIKSGN